MRAIVLRSVWIAVLGACGVAEPESTGEATQEIEYRNDIFYDKFDFLGAGSVGGQAGWSGNCEVVPGVAPDKNLDCTGGPGLVNGRGAMHSFFRPANRNYHLQFDVWTHGVVDATHGKIFLENPPGDGSNALFQIAIGCDNIRASYKYYGHTTKTLLSFPCSNGPHYRVACIWRDGGTEFRCGASVLPNDPVEANFVSIPAVNQLGHAYPIGPFDRVRVLGGIGQRVGTTTFDKVQILSD
jgi:hypothetical protein